MDTGGGDVRAVRRGTLHLDDLPRIDALVHHYAEEREHHFFPGHRPHVHRSVRIRIELPGELSKCALTMSFVPFVTLTGFARL